jgi:drug/metabolite transporter (DMT)-like permease
MTSVDGTIAAVLAAAFAHASWNALVKSSPNRLLMLTAIRVVGLITGVTLATQVPIPDAGAWPFLVLAAVCHTLYFALMLQSYRLGDMSQAYPIARGTAPILVTILSAAFVGEVPSLQSWLAVGLISLGILIIALSGTHFNRPLVAFALITGVVISGYSLLSGVGIRRTSNWLSYVAWLEIFVSCGMVLFVAIKHRAAAIEFAQSQWMLAILAGVLSVGGYMVALWAMTRNAIGPIVALRETSVVFAAIIGSIVLKEGFAKKRIGAAVVVAIGVVLMALGR